MHPNTWLKIGGGLSIVGGILALLNPFAASMAVEHIAAWSFLLAGLFQLAGIFQKGSVGRKLWLGFWGVLSVYLGVSLFSNPLGGLMTLTFIAGLVLIISGFVRALLAFFWRKQALFLGLMISALLSLGLGFYILGNHPEASLTVLGTFLGIELIFNGIGMFAAGRLIGGEEPKAVS